VFLQQKLTAFVKRHSRLRVVKKRHKKNKTIEISEKIIESSENTDPEKPGTPEKSDTEKSDPGKNVVIINKPPEIMVTPRAFFFLTLVAS
jgi:hypothetical protein